MTGKYSYKEAFLALSDLHTQLREAHKSANTADDKDSIFAAMQIVNDEMHEILRKSLDDSNDDYNVLTTDVGNINAQLSAARDRIDKIIKSVSLAAKIVSAIDKVLAVLAVV